MMKIEEYEYEETINLGHNEYLPERCSVRKFVCDICNDEDREMCMDLYCEFISDLTQRGVYFKTTGKVEEGLYILTVKSRFRTPYSVDWEE